jgi:hypothetical protein
MCSVTLFGQSSINYRANLSPLTATNGTSLTLNLALPISLLRNGLRLFILISRIAQLCAQSASHINSKKLRRLTMKGKSLYLLAVLVFVFGLVFVGVTLAQRPATDIDPARHPALADAQHHIVQAFDKIDEAQNANHDQLGGDAQKAKDLLVQASRELKAAAVYADRHHT